MEKIYNVLEFGVKPDGITLSSAAVQSVIDICSHNGGGKVFFPKGIYVLSTIFLKNNVHIHFEDGTEILGSLNFYDYAQQEEIDYPLYQDESHSYFNLSMFVALNCKNIKITGNAKIDMRSVWDEDGVRGEYIYHRGPKCISLKECQDIVISDVEIYNATDLAVYFAGCENVDIHGIKMKVYIDGISPDNSKNVRIYDCDVEAGDDAIVFKSSYTLNRLDYCKNIKVSNCKVKSRCNAVKFGTETNGGFFDIEIENIEIFDVRTAGLVVQSIDGAVIDGISFKNIKMQNVNAPLYVHIGTRMRGSDGREIGKIKNVSFENITAKGPYAPYEIMPENYFTFKREERIQYPWIYHSKNNDDIKLRENGMNTPWQYTSNMCGRKDSFLENITLKNVHLELVGGVSDYKKEVPEETGGWCDVDAYGKILPAKGIYFRYIDNLVLDNVSVKTKMPDTREDFVCESVLNCDRT